MYDDIFCCKKKVIRLYGWVVIRVKLFLCLLFLNKLLIYVFFI